MSSNAASLQKNLECPVCLQSEYDSFFTICANGHGVCSTCKNETLQSGICPCCRQALLTDGPIRNRHIEAAVAAVSKLVAEGKPLTTQRLKLAIVYDFWHPLCRCLTFHAGDPWPVAPFVCEARKAIQFYAFALAAPGTVPIYSFWNPSLRQWTIHASEPWGQEQRRDVQFYAWPRDATALPSDAIPIFDFWNPSLRQLTFHKGAPWGKEERKALQFWALASPELPRWQCDACGASALEAEAAECDVCGAARQWPPAIENAAAAGLRLAAPRQGAYVLRSSESGQIA